MTWFELWTWGSPDKPCAFDPNVLVMRHTVLYIFDYLSCVSTLINKILKTENWNSLLTSFDATSTWTRFSQKVSSKGGYTHFPPLNGRKSEMFRSKHTVLFNRFFLNGRGGYAPPLMEFFCDWGLWAGPLVCLIACKLQVPLLCPPYLPWHVHLFRTINWQIFL